MAITHSAGTKEAIGNLIDDLVNTGATNATGIIAILDGAVVVAEVVMANPAFGVANGTTGQIAAASTPLAWTAIANGPVVDIFEVWNRNEGVVYSGTVTATGGGGDMTVDNTNIANGQSGTITSFTYTPG